MARRLDAEPATETVDCVADSVARMASVASVIPTCCHHRAVEEWRFHSCYLVAEEDPARLLSRRQRRDNDYCDDDSDYRNGPAEHHPVEHVHELVFARE